MKKTTLIIPCIIASLSLFGFTGVKMYAAKTPDVPQLSCGYNSKFQQCMIANQNGNTRSLDFVCPITKNKEHVLGQIILDEEFQELDKQALEFIAQLESNVAGAYEDDIEMIDAISRQFSSHGYLYKKYESLCTGGILAQRAECSGEKISTLGTSQWIFKDTSENECMTLVKNKLDIFKQVSESVLKLNKGAYLQDTRQEYFGKQREKFNALSDQMNTLSGHSERLSSGITHYTPNPLQ